MVTYENMHQGVFLARPNRFIAHVELDGQTVVCHVKNTGRCKELLIPGCTVYCQHHDNPARKTQWSLIGVNKGGRLINMDSQVPNALAKDWVEAGNLGFIPEDLRREKTWGDSRFDLFFRKNGLDSYLEVKGVTLEADGVVRFPDAPTQRGTKHLLELCKVAQGGIGAYLLFVVQMDNVTHLEPNTATDPAFAQALAQCIACGVQVLAVTCHVTPNSIEILKKIPVVLS